MCQQPDRRQQEPPQSRAMADRQHQIHNREKYSSPSYVTLKILPCRFQSFARSLWFEGGSACRRFSISAVSHSSSLKISWIVCNRCRRSSIDPWSDSMSALCVCIDQDYLLRSIGGREFRTSLLQGTATSAEAHPLAIFLAHLPFAVPKFD